VPPVLPSGEQFEIRRGASRAVAVEVGGGLRLYDDVLLGYGEDEMCTAGRGQVLAPWPNRLEDGTYEFAGMKLQLPIAEPSTFTAMHGLVRFASWRAVDRSEDAVTLEHELHPQPGYPFSLVVRVTYRLTERGLEVETVAENAGHGAAPFGIAFHPYFAGRVDELEVTLPARTRLEVNERKLPIGRAANDLPRTFRVGARQIDAAFTDFDEAVVGVGDHALWFDDAFRYVQLFTGDHPQVGRAGLAVEPMTCPANAFRTGEGLIVLEPGDVFRARWGIGRS
jgi:aldose 1-epimerase